MDMATAIEDVTGILSAAVEDSTHFGPSCRAMDYQTLENVALDFAALFDSEYIGFDRVRFLRDCGLDEEAE